MVEVTLVTLILENIKVAEIAFKTSFWSSLLKVILFLIVIKIETEGSLLVQIRHSPFIWLSTFSSSLCTCHLFSMHLLHACGVSCHNTGGIEMNKAGSLIARISNTIDKSVVRIQRTDTEVHMWTDAIKAQRKVAGTKPKLSP